MKFIDITEKESTVAIQDNCYFDFIDVISSLMSQLPEDSIFKMRSKFSGSRYTMPETYKTIVKCREGDEYSVAEGRRQAAKKLEANKKRSMIKRAYTLRDDIFRGLELVEKWLEKNDPNFEIYES